MASHKAAFLPRKQAHIICLHLTVQGCHDSGRVAALPLRPVALRERHLPLHHRRRHWHLLLSHRPHLHPPEKGKLEHFVIVIFLAAATF